MALKDLYKEYEVQTEILSNICRQLGFASGGIIWLFRQNGEIELPFLPLIVLITLLIYFLFDLLQFFLAAKKIKEIFSSCHDKYESKNVKINPELECIRKRSDFIWSKRFMYWKVYALLVTYGILIVYYTLVLLGCL
tara:strand:- start:39299 stop:39709 length:411 start_codon:yes stop_codon:yes gene_type:complete